MISCNSDVKYVVALPYFSEKIFMQMVLSTNRLLHKHIYFHKGYGALFIQLSSDMMGER